MQALLLRPSKTLFLQQTLNLWEVSYQLILAPCLWLQYQPVPGQRAQYGQVDARHCSVMYGYLVLQSLLIVSEGVVSQVGIPEARARPAPTPVFLHPSWVSWPGGRPGPPMPWRHPLKLSGQNSVCLPQTSLEGRGQSSSSLHSDVARTASHPL